jgi:hypothetical protein
VIGAVLRAFHALHGIALAAAAVGLFAFWLRTRLWLPRYVHVLALLATMLGVGMACMVPDDAPINRQLGPLGYVVVVAIFPALVYFFFVFYGGQRAAYDRMMRNSGRSCPFCRAPLDSADVCCVCGQRVDLAPSAQPARPGGPHV